ncbi:hypothetical protein LXA43DRAFT_1099467 [Ganoderma leucocontextum]|nr:hypothetical protein LXA43DRAFT_1099467 [Ganoderma leucocontextum]
MPANHSGVSQIRKAVPVGRSQPVANVRGPVIVIDDNDVPPGRKGKSGKRKPPKQAPQPLTSRSEIIEISSDEDKSPAKKPRVDRSADRKQKKALKKGLKAALDATEAVTADLDPVPASGSAAEVKKTSAQTDKHLMTIIAEKIDCPICFRKMWRPYTLTECGHSFCVSCLQVWFNTAYAKHLDEYPAYNPQQLIPATVRAQLARADIPPRIRRDLKSMVAGIFHETRRPQFSCPNCREPVHAPPVENFVLKDLIHTIGDPAQGEPPHEGSTRALLVEVRLDEPFCGFFPFAKYM